jgi:hypothetical protein
MRTIEARLRRVMPITFVLWLAGSAAAADVPPDLRLQWTGKEATVRGVVGAKVDLEYELSNIGGSPAFAVIVRAQTTVGPVTAPIRIQPGPKPGAGTKRKVSFTLVRGMREICIDAALQHRDGGEPPEANFDNNRICRAISIDAQTARSEEAAR